MLYIVKKYIDIGSIYMQEHGGYYDFHDGMEVSRTEHFAFDTLVEAQIFADHLIKTHSQNRDGDSCGLNTVLIIIPNDDLGDVYRDGTYQIADSKGNIMGAISASNRHFGVSEVWGEGDGVEKYLIPTTGEIAMPVYEQWHECGRLFQNPFWANPDLRIPPTSYRPMGLDLTRRPQPMKETE